MKASTPKIPKTPFIAAFSVGAGDGHNDQHGRQAQGYDLLLSHDSFFLSFMYLNKFGETNFYRITAYPMR